MGARVGRTGAWACLLALAAAGCAVSQADPTPPKGPAAAPRAAVSSSHASAIVRVFAGSARDTINLSPEEGPPRPSIEYPSLEAVRDSVLAIVRRVTPRGDTAIHVSVGPTRFKYWYLPDSASGYAVHITVTDTSSCPAEDVGQALTRAGWGYHSGYSADGPDGTVMGFETGKYVAILEGSWEGGDPTDTTYVPARGCEVKISCVPRRKDDVMP